MSPFLTEKLLAFETECVVTKDSPKRVFVPPLVFLFHIEIQEDFAEISFDSYFRTVDEFTAPFQDSTSAVYQAGLRLVAIDTKVTPCPLQEEWLKQENKEGVHDDVIK